MYTSCDIQFQSTAHLGLIANGNVGLLLIRCNYVGNRFFKNQTAQYVPKKIYIFSDGFFLINDI